MKKILKNKVNIKKSSAQTDIFLDDNENTSLDFDKTKIKSPKQVFAVSNNSIDADSKTVEIVTDSRQKVLNRRTNKGKIANIVFFCISILILIITLLVQSKAFGIQKFSDVVGDLNYKYIWLIILTFVGIMLFDSFRTHILIYRATGINRPVLSFKSTAICRYYDCVTPFTFGGQPFQIFYLNSRGVNPGVASSVPMAKYMFSQISFCLIALVMLIVGISKALFTKAESATVLTLSIISLVICFLFLFAIIFITISKKLTPKVMRGLIKFGSKLKIVKNPTESYRKSLQTIHEYQRSIWYYLRSFWCSTVSFILSVGIIVLKGVIPFLIYKSFYATGAFTFGEIFCKFMVIELATMFVPLPGGAGVAEISFTALFSSMFLSKHVFWALLFYRIGTYYIYLLLGIFVNVYDIALGNKRDEKFKNTKLIQLQSKAKGGMSTSRKSQK